VSARREDEHQTPRKGSGQAELFGLLARLRDLGAALLAVEPLADDDPPDG
jgi:hypothetical protein